MTVLTIAAIWGCVLIIGLAAWMIVCHHRGLGRRVAQAQLTTTDIEWLESQRGGRS